MILQHFSWQELLVVFLVFSIAWYAAVLLLYYRRELLTFFNSKMVVSSAVAPQRSVGVDKRSSESSADMDAGDNGAPEVMGKSRLPEGMSIISVDLIRFSDQVVPASAG